MVSNLPFSSSKYPLQVVRSTFRQREAKFSKILRVILLINTNGQRWEASALLLSGA